MRNCLIAATVLAAVTATAQDAPTVDEIVRKANHMAYYQGKDGRAQVKMTVTDAQGRTRTKEFTILRLNKDEDDKALGGVDKKDVKERAEKIIDQCWWFYRAVDIYESSKILLRAIEKHHEFRKDPEEFKKEHKIDERIEVHQ